MLVKGGHLEGDDGHAVDVFYDGKEFDTLPESRFIDTPHTHGTGCTYASAIAAYLARGFELKDAIAYAKEYVTEAIRYGLAISAKALALRTTFIL